LGVADFTMADGGEMKGVRIYSRWGVSWALPPLGAAPFASRDEAERWSAAMVHATRQAHPEGLDARLWRSEPWAEWLASKLNLIEFPVEKTVALRHPAGNESPAAVSNVRPAPAAESVAPAGRVPPAAPHDPDQGDLWRSAMEAGKEALAGQQQVQMAGMRVVQ
jgi:hypothetical protein